MEEIKVWTKYQVPAESVLDPKAEESYLFSQESRLQALKDLRIKLDHYLVGPAFSKDRQKFVCHFISSYNNHTPTNINTQLCLAFFDCLLDKEFTVFNLTGGVENHPFCVKIDPAQLLPIINLRCSDLLLQTLSLSFGDRIQPMDVDTFPLFPNVNHFLKGFKHLTSLELKCFTRLNDDALLPFYTALGDACPNLSILDLDVYVIFRCKNRVLALVLGRRRELLPRQILYDDCSSNFGNLQFAAGCVTPICLSLRKIKFNEDITLVEIAFLLRHCPNLYQIIIGEEFKIYWLGAHDVPLGVQLLHQQQLATNRKSQLPSITSQNSSPELGRIDWTTNAPFLGIY